MFTFPAKLYRRFGGYLVVPILLITAFAFIMVGRVTFRSGFTLFLPSNDPYRLLEEHVSRTFSQDNLIIVALDVDSLIAPADLLRIQQVVQDAREVPGTSSVVSLTNLEDLYLEGETLERRLIYQPELDSEAALLTERVMSTPLFREFFVSKDGTALYTYVVPETDVVPAVYGSALVSALEAPELHFFGDSVVKAYVSRAVMEELILLGALALVVVFLVEVIISRSFLVGLVLSVASMVPAIWTLALFPLLGTAVETNTMMVPVIVLVLATSYGIHIYRYHALGHADMADTLDHVAPIVMAAGFTTIIGFVSLLVTPSRILTQLGTLIIFGVSAALITSFLLLPPILDPLTRRLRRRARTRPRRGERARQDRLPQPLRWLSQPAKHPVRRLVIVGVIVAGLAASIPAVRSGYSTRDTFRKGTTISQTVQYFQERAGATHDLQVYMDTGEEYGLVYFDAYQTLRSVEQHLEADPLIARSISYVDFVEFMVGRLAGSLEPIQPKNDAEVGEAMELLSGEGVGLSFEALVDTTWQQTRFLLQANVPSISDAEGVDAVESLLVTVRSLFGASTDLWAAGGRRHVGFQPEQFASAAVLGVPVENLQYIRYLTRSQFMSLIALAPLIVGFLVVVFRSLKWAVLSLTPTMVGVVVYFGVLGLSGILHDPIHVFMVAALMGVANDDVLYYVLVFRRERLTAEFSDAIAATVHKTGAAIIQTTLILVAGIATFYFSRFILLGRAGLVVTIGLLAATTTTLVVIPAILQLGPGKRWGKRAQRKRSGLEEIAPQ